MSLDVIITDIHAGKNEKGFEPMRTERAIENMIAYLQEVSTAQHVRLLFGGDLTNKIEEPNKHFYEPMARKQLAPLGDFLSSAKNIDSTLVSGNCDRPMFSDPQSLRDLLGYHGPKEKMVVSDALVHHEESFRYFHGDILEPSLGEVVQSGLIGPSAGSRDRHNLELIRALVPGPETYESLLQKNLKHERSYTLFQIYQAICGKMGVLPYTDAFLKRGINRLYAGAVTEFHAQLADKHSRNVPWINGHTHFATVQTAEQLSAAYGKKAPPYYVDAGTATADKRDVGTIVELREGVPKLQVTWQPDITDRVSKVDELDPWWKAQVS